MTETARVVVGFGLGGALLAVVAWALGGVGSRTATGLVVTCLVASCTVWLVDRMARRSPRPASASPDDDPFAQLMLRRQQHHRLPAPPEREDLHRLVQLAIGTAGDAHDRLRPVLREIAEARARAVRGTALDETDWLQRLDPRLADWLRPDRAPPADRFASGIPPQELAALLDALEQLDDLEEQRWTTP